MTAYKAILLTAIATFSFGLARSAAALPPVATAALDSVTADVAIAPEKLQLAQMRLAHMQQIADHFSGEAVALGFTDNAWRFELVNHLMRADQATIARVESSPDLRSALQTAAASGAQAKSLGEAANDLVYVPITPCRIVDTRNSGAGGNFIAKESRTYTYAGGAAQGGATCAFTAGAIPAALAINVTVVSVGLGNDAAAFGFLAVYPEGGSPTSSWMNYLGSDIKANAGVAAIKQADGKFSVFAQNPTHVIVDLFGVFRAATDGTPNFIAKWDGAGTLGTSSIWDGGAGRIGVVMPQGNGHGRVGINTTTPLAPLEVDDYVQFQGLSTYYAYLQLSGNTSNVSTCHFCYANVSIYASNNVMALEFDADSDARIKNIRGVSESARDLDTLMRIEVTDYTLKDRIREGDRPFKKVVAQQVENVYPQVVTRHVDFIPNIYRTADSVKSNSAGITTLHFAEPHGMDADAKRLKLLVEGDNAMRKIAVLGVPSAHDVVIDATDLEGKRVFVYGEEVDDFRTVDYEGLTTLNISATQELVRRMQRQQADANVAARAKDAQIASLRAELAAQSGRIDALHKFVANVSLLRASTPVAGQGGECDMTQRP